MGGLFFEWPLNGKYNSELTEIILEYNSAINLKITENEKHISNVEQLLSSSESFEVTDKIKSFAADWAVDKKAPFKGDKKNSMADALILFSSIEHIKTISTIEIFDEPYLRLGTSIFVSGNKGDYCSSADDNKIHEDLVQKLEEVKMGFFNSLPKALNFIDATLFKEAEIRKIEQEMNELYEDNTYYCDTCSPDDENQYLNVVNFSNSEIVEEESSEFENPNQLKFDFVEYTNIPITDPKKAHSIQRGFCLWCSTEHIKCENCNTITALDDGIDDHFECDGCGIIYKIHNKYVGHGMFEQSISVVSTKSEILDDEDNGSS